MNAQKKHGCLFWFGIVVAVFLLLFLLTIYAAYSYTKSLIAKYTDTKPIAAPTVHMSGAEITNLQQRVRTFGDGMKSNLVVAPLTLSADEINALIWNQTRSNASPGRLYFSFNSNQVQAQLSVPMDGMFGHWLDGRYLNGSGNFSVSLHDGHLALRVKSLSVKGQPFPEKFMQPLRAQNFAEGWTNDPDLSEMIGRFQEIKIENGKLIVIPKPPEAQLAPKLEKPETTN